MEPWEMFNSCATAQDHHSGGSSIWSGLCTNSPLTVSLERHAKDWTREPFAPSGQGLARPFHLISRSQRVWHPLYPNHWGAPLLNQSFTLQWWAGEGWGRWASFTLCHFKWLFFLALTLLSFWPLPATSSSWAYGSLVATILRLWVPGLPLMHRSYASEKLLLLPNTLPSEVFIHQHIKLWSCFYTLIWKLSSSKLHLEFSPAPILSVTSLTYFRSWTGGGNGSCRFWVLYCEMSSLRCSSQDCTFHSLLFFIYYATWFVNIFSSCKQFTQIVNYVIVVISVTMTKDCKMTSCHQIWKPVERVFPFVTSGPILLCVTHVIVIVCASVFLSVKWGGCLAFPAVFEAQQWVKVGLQRTHWECGGAEEHGV